MGPRDVQRDKRFFLQLKRHSATSEDLIITRNLLLTHTLPTSITTNHHLHYAAPTMRYNGRSRAQRAAWGTLRSLLGLCSGGRTT
jgi:hypothetical protein